MPEVHPQPGEMVLNKGGSMFVALALWSVARFLVAYTWRDPAIAGPLSVEQLLALGVLVIAIAGFVERWRAPLHAPALPRAEADARPA